jgi:hypothetical protein
MAERDKTLTSLIVPCEGRLDEGDWTSLRMQWYEPAVWSAYHPERGLI